LDGEQARLNTCWKYFNPPKRLWGATFENYVPKHRAQAAALQACQTYTIDDIRQGKGLLLVSEIYGTGKSHLSVATVRALMESSPDLFGIREDENNLIYDAYNQAPRGLTCSFFSVVELLDLWRPGSEAKRQKGDWLFHRAKVDDLVILDDIGAEKASEWTEDRLFAVVDARWRMERATIFTTNCKEKQLIANGYGRIVSRIFEMTDPILVDGPDHRRKGA
jgi:DNA replication protein DnaC